jgi:hypothetical protein
MAFAIVGDGWPCTAWAQVDIFMRDTLIAKASTDANGDFEISIEVILDVSSAQIPVLDPPDNYLVLYRDQLETVRAVLTSHPQCSSTQVRTTTVTFISPEL